MRQSALPRAAQVPIRETVLHLSNELISLNELKTLTRREVGKMEGEVEMNETFKGQRKPNGVV